MSASLLARLRAAREAWVDLLPGKKVKVRRPTEAQMAAIFEAPDESSKPEKLAAHVVAWEGFTEADLLGASVGTSDPVEFSQELFAEVIADKSEWRAKVSAAISDSIMAHLEARSARSGNSETTSQPAGETTAS